MPKFLTFAEVCDTVKLSRPRIYQLVDAGEFPAPHKLNPAKGGRVLWPLETIEAWLAERAPKQAV
jgi:excisionase family DNA binding protein